MDETKQILWALDSEIQPRDFERLCVDLLGREGYQHIEPSGGTKDHGRDAEITFWKGASLQRSVLAFQFSLDKKWEQKLSNDAATIATHCPEVVELVFVTSQKVTGAKKDQLRTEFKSRYGWELAVYDREWLRHRLGEQSQDLAKKYLSLDLPPTICYAALQIELSDYDEQAAREVFQQTNPELLRASILEATRKEPSIIDNWQRLAQFEYLIRNYDSALEAVTTALRLQPHDKVSKLNLELFRGAILAEKAILERSRPLLVQAKSIFSEAVQKLRRSVDHYNLANVLDALGENEEAERHYSRSVELEPTNARAWKNFGSHLIKVGKCDVGMECFEKALQLNPNIVEGLLSKGAALLKFYGKAEEAIKCFDAAYRIAPELDRKWPYIRYWYSRALLMLRRYEEALKQVEIELSLRPGSRHLLNQKASVLSKLWIQNQAYEDEALEFLKFRAQAIPNDYAGLADLIEIYKKRGHPEEAWSSIEVSLACPPFSVRELSLKTKISIADFQIGFQNARLYRHFRKQFSLEDHCRTLRGYGLRTSSKIVPALNQLLIVPFGMAARQLKELSNDQCLDKLQSIWAALLNSMSVSFPVFGAYWLANEKPTERDQQTTLLSLGIVYFFDVVVAEAARQFSFLADHHGVSLENILQAQNGDWNRMRVDVGMNLFGEVAVDWELAQRK
jgi:tetratricopeptide (TPR) repeat protein